MRTARNPGAGSGQRAMGPTGAPMPATWTSGANCSFGRSEAETWGYRSLAEPGARAPPAVPRQSPAWLTLWRSRHPWLARVSRRVESHPPALSEPGVSLSTHRAPTDQWSGESDKLPGLSAVASPRRTAPSVLTTSFSDLATRAWEVHHVVVPVEEDPERGGLRLGGPGGPIVTIGRPVWASNSRPSRPLTWPSAPAPNTPSSAPRCPSAFPLRNRGRCL